MIIFVSGLSESQSQNMIILGSSLLGERVLSVYCRWEFRVEIYMHLLDL
jgi:hypothetical protein